MESLSGAILPRGEIDMETTKLNGVAAKVNGHAVKNLLPPADVDGYVKRITATWQNAAASIIETGRILTEAKRNLPHGEFGKMIDEKLPFSRRAAQMLMAIAKNPVLSNPKFVSFLPPSWGTLYELTAYPDGELKEMIADRTINPETRRRDVDATERHQEPSVPTPSAEDDAEQGRKRRRNSVYVLNPVIRLADEYPNPKELVDDLFNCRLSDEVDHEKLERLGPWITTFSSLYNNEIVTRAHSARLRKLNRKGKKARRQARRLRAGYQNYLLALTNPRKATNTSTAS
jgi:hypothetical protein